MAHGPPGSIACPLCRHGIVSFVKLPGTKPLLKDIPRTSLPLSFCSCSSGGLEPTSLKTPLCNPDLRCARISPIGSSFRSLSYRRFPSVKLNSSLCMGASDVSPSLVRQNVDRRLVSCSRPRLRRATTHIVALFS